MKFTFGLILLIAVAGCSKEEPAAPAPPSNAPPVAMKADAPPAPPIPAPVVESPAPPPPTRPPSAPSTGPHLPAFTIRTMDHKRARVELDGEELTAPCLWSITSAFKGTEKLGSTWPPEGAKYGGKSVHPGHPASFAEVYVVPEVPRLRPGECLLAVVGAVDGTTLLGAVRLYVEGYRFTVYTPLDIPPGEDASKFNRTLWFERIAEDK